MTDKPTTIFLLLSFPHPWPREVGVILLEKDGVRVEGDKDGRIVVTTSGETIASRQIRFDGFGLVSLGVTVNPHQIYLNGQKVSPDDGDQMRIKLPDGAPPAEDGPVFLTLEPDSGVGDEERLFVNTILDIDARCQKRTQYDLLKAAGMLRLLLTDGLVDRIARRYRTQPRFVVHDTRRVARTVPLDFDEQWLMLAPSNARRPTSVSAQELLALPVFLTKNSVCTVKHLIKACANARGGVHFGPPKATQVEEIALLEGDEDVRILNGKAISFEQLAGLCRIVLVGLVPLAIAVSSGGPPDAPSPT